MKNERGDDLQWVWFNSEAQKELEKQGYYMVRTEYRKAEGGNSVQWALMAKQEEIEEAERVLLLAARETGEAVQAVKDELEGLMDTLSDYELGELAKHLAKDEYTADLAKALRRFRYASKQHKEATNNYLATVAKQSS
jgi:hypothetical protein